MKWNENARKRLTNSKEVTRVERSHEGYVAVELLSAKMEFTDC
jgi:hypothetical protein